MLKYETMHLNRPIEACKPTDKGLATVLQRARKNSYDVIQWANSDMLKNQKQLFEIFTSFLERAQ